MFEYLIVLHSIRVIFIVIFMLDIYYIFKVMYCIFFLSYTEAEDYNINY